MKLVKHTLYISLKEMIECGFNESSLMTAKSKGTKCWTFINDPDDNRKVLVGYDKMTDANKEKVKARFGNPYDMVARTPIFNMVTQDAAANEYYKQYRYGQGEYLTISTVNKYTRAASWLNMLNKVQEDRTIIKKMGIKIHDFYTHAGELIKSEIANTNKLAT